MGGMKRLLLLLPLVALAGCKDPQDGVKVVVSYTQFVPGCVRVTAVDDASGDQRSTDVAVREKKPAPDGEIVVGILMPEKWGTALTITADAYEAFPKDGQCIGPRVRNNQQGISVPKGSSKDGSSPELHLAVDAPDMDGDGYVSTASGGTDCNDNIGSGKMINPGATELCNDIDDNCDGATDEGFQLGVSCTNTANGCTGTFRCAANPQQNECFTPDARGAWADEDKDQHGDMNRGLLVVCTAALPENRLPQSAPHDDCDDTNPAVHPGALELCNNIDDNCINGVDEGFNLGMTCFDDRTNCEGGTRQCDLSDGGTQCVPPPTVVKTWFPDEDNDSHGREDAGVVSCPQPDAGYILDAGDCDDGNPFIHRDATEICDGQDNNCNGGTDENSACPAGAPTWMGKQVGLEDNRTWYGISVYGDGGVWVVGSDGGRAVKRPMDTDFAMLGGECSGAGSPFTFNGVWSNSQGKAFIGGSKKSLLIQEPTSTNCQPRSPPELGGAGVGGNMTTTDLFGFASASDPEDVQLFGVTLDGDDGATYKWTGATVTVPVTKLTDTTFQGIHGISPEVMFAVGSYKNPEHPNARARIFRYMPQTSTWSGPVEPPGVKGLNAVWVVNPKLAYAVGDVGAFLKWDGNTWSMAPSPSPTERLTGVIAFGWNSVYVASEAGKVYRYNDGQWNSTPSPGTALYGISGTRPDDIWAIGSFGKVFHYPAWPQ